MLTVEELNSIIDIPASQIKGIAEIKAAYISTCNEAFAMGEEDWNYTKKSWDAHNKGNFDLEESLRHEAAVCSYQQTKLQYRAVGLGWVLGIPESTTCYYCDPEL